MKAFVCVLALIIAVENSTARAAELSLNAKSDLDSAYFEYFSNGFLRMDQFAPNNPMNQNFHDIDDPSINYNQNFDGFPNDRQFRFGSVQYDDSGLVGGTGSAPITGVTLNIVHDPANAAYINWRRFTANTRASTDYRGCEGANAGDPSVAHWNLKGWQSGVVARRYVAAKETVDGLSATALLVEGVGGKQLFGPGGGPHTPPEIWDPVDGAWVGRSFSGVSPANYGQRMKTGLCTVNCSNMYYYGPYSFHPNVAQIVLCDGAVRALSEEIDPAVLSALYPYADGQVGTGF